MICSNCGNIMMDNMKFCPSCGTPVAQQQATQNANQPLDVAQPEYQQSPVQQEIPQPVQQPEYQQTPAQQQVQQPPIQQQMQQPAYQQSPYQQPINNQNFGGNIPQNSFNQQYPINNLQPIAQPAAGSSGKGVASIVLAVIGFFGNLFLAILGWIFGGIGLGLAFSARSKNPNDKAAKIGLIFSAITLVASLMNSILGVIVNL